MVKKLKKKYSGLFFASFLAAIVVCFTYFAIGCTFETRNKISRTIQNFTGTNGVVDVFSNGKVMYRFLGVEKLTTADPTEKDAANTSRAYRFGYGILDMNYNFKVDDNEKRVYFEVSNHSSPYMFYENPFAEGEGGRWNPGEK